MFLDLEKPCKNMLLDIFKLFPSRFKDATSPYFHLIMKHCCHQTVNKGFLEDKDKSVKGEKRLSPVDVSCCNTHKVLTRLTPHSLSVLCYSLESLFTFFSFLPFPFTSSKFHGVFLGISIPQKLFGLSWSFNSMKALRH